MFVKNTVEYNTLVNLLHFVSTCAAVHLEGDF